MNRLAQLFAETATITELANMYHIAQQFPENITVIAEAIEIQYQQHLQEMKYGTN
jgi:hypothetical protein